MMLTLLACVNHNTLSVQFITISHFGELVAKLYEFIKSHLSVYFTYAPLRAAIRGRSSRTDIITAKFFFIFCLRGKNKFEYRVFFGKLLQTPRIHFALA